jgi:hypothetical protein
MEPGLFSGDRASPAGFAPDRANSIFVPSFGKAHLLAILLSLLSFGLSAEEVPGERLRASADIRGRVSAFTPAKGRILEGLKVEAIPPDVKRVIIHVSPACSGTIGLYFDGRPSTGQTLRGLPEQKPFYVKVIGVGTVDLRPVYK